MGAGQLAPCKPFPSRIAVPALDCKSRRWDFCLPPSSAREEDPDVPCRCAGVGRGPRARSLCVSPTDDALCPPASVSGGETVVSSMKAVGSWAGRGDRALAEDGSGQLMLSTHCRALIFLLEAEKSMAGSGHVGVLWSDQTNLGGLTAHHHPYTIKGRLMSAVSVLERNLPPGESIPPPSTSS